MESSDEQLFYKNASSENSIWNTRCLFEGIVSTNDVYAEYEINEERMVSLHNHMNSSSMWKSISQWDSGVRYTIDHPDGDITITDRNRGENTTIFRETTQEVFRGMTYNGDIEFSLFKINKEPVDFSLTSCHSSNYTWVKIESRKTFKYESERAAWDFSLAVVWEGVTKESAEASDKKFFVSISMASIDKASRDPGYTTASFMEKLMDTLFQRSKSRHIVFV